MGERLTVVARDGGDHGLVAVAPATLDALGLGPGDFVREGRTLLKAAPADRLPESFDHSAREAFTLGETRTHEQDVLFAADQLVVSGPTNERVVAAVPDAVSLTDRDGQRLAGEQGVGLTANSHVGPTRHDLGARLRTWVKAGGPTVDSRWENAVHQQVLPPFVDTAFEERDGRPRRQVLDGVRVPGWIPARGAIWYRRPMLART